MVIELHELSLSPYCQAVHMLATLLNIKVESKVVNLFQGEHLTPEYTALNPFNKVPTLVDDGFVVYESRAILRYLVNKQASENSLYPKDVKDKAIVDQMLDVDASNISPAVHHLINRLLKEDKEPTDEDNEKVQAALRSLDSVLGKHSYVAGDKLTIADIAIRATLVFLEVLDFSLDNHKNIPDWVVRVTNQIPNYAQINHEPAKLLREVIEGKRAARA